MIPPLIGKSENIEQVRDLIRHTAGLAFHTVIYGESGVGKEVVARHLHHTSPRRNHPFVIVNCAALPDSLLDSELFGHEKGAFTGAVKRRRGKFEVAHGGILFLDEIGDMSPQLQTRLLHVLESGKFSPLGSEEDIRTDTWVITATNCSLEDKVLAGTFREDLYYRLNIIRIPVAPLREKVEDLPLLIDYYWNLYNTGNKTGKACKPGKRILERLSQYHWPGNVRELQSVLRRFFLVGNWNDIISDLLKTVDRRQDNFAPLPSFVEPIIDEAVNGQHAASLNLDTLSLKTIKTELIDKVEREVIRHTLLKTGWNRRQASKMLDIAYYTLNRKISDLTITPPPYLS